MKSKDKINLIIFFMILCWSIWPIVSGFLAENIAEFYASSVNEAGPIETIVNGEDIGPNLHRMFTSTWLMFITLPTGFIALIGFVISVSSQEAKERRQKKQIISEQKANL